MIGIMTGRAANTSPLPTDCVYPICVIPLCNVFRISRDVDPGVLGGSSPNENM